MFLRQVDRDGARVNVDWIANRDAYKLHVRRYQGDSMVARSHVVESSEVFRFADATHCSLAAAADEVLTVKLAVLKAMLPAYTVSEALVAGERRRQSDWPEQPWLMTMAS